MSTQTITFVLADDHPLLSQGCKVLLETEPDFQVVGVAQDGLEAVRLVQALRPNLLVLDLALPRLHGLEVVRQVVQRVPATQVLILSMHAEPSMVREALRAGAGGYVLKDDSVEDLVRAVRQLLSRRRFLSPRLAELAVQAFTNPDEAGGDAFEHLTKQERMVFQLAAQGLSAKEMAQSLFISPRTVEVHRKHILHKLGLRSQTELVLLAVRRGVIEA